MRRGSALREIGIIPDGALLIRDGLIADVGPTRRIENLSAARNAQVIEARGRVVMPIFSDSGVQLVAPPPLDEESLFTAADTAKEQLNRLARYLTATSADRLKARARQMGERLLRHGTGAMEAPATPGSNASAALKAMRVSAELDRSLMSVASTLVAEDSESSTAVERDAAFQHFLKETLPTTARRHLASALALPVGGETYDPEQTWGLAETARSLGLALNIDASVGSTTQALEIASELAARAITGLGMLTEEHLTVLQSIPAAVVVNPASSTAPPVLRTMADQGVAIALGTGFSASQPGTYSMQEVVYEAAAVHGLLLREALTAATLNAAYAIGLGSEVGSLEHGKRADLLVLNMPDYRDLGTRRGVNFVHLVLRRGEVIYREAPVKGS